MIKFIFGEALAPLLSYAGFWLFVAGFLTAGLDNAPLPILPIGLLLMFFGVIAGVIGEIPGWVEKWRFEREEKNSVSPIASYSGSKALHRRTYGGSYTSTSVAIRHRRLRTGSRGRGY